MTAQGHEQRARLVAEIARFLERWQERLQGRAAWDPAVISLSEQEAERLRASAEAAGVGGLVHHLRLCREHLKAGASNESELRESLRAVSEITWQLKQEWMPLASASPAAGLAIKSPEPPRLLTGHWKMASDPGGGRADPSVSAPPLLSVAISNFASPPELPKPAVEPEEVAPDQAPRGNFSRRSQLSSDTGVDSPKGILATVFGLRAFGSAARNRGVPPRGVGGERDKWSGRADQSGFPSESIPSGDPLTPPLLPRPGLLPPISEERDAKPAMSADLEDRLRKIRPGYPGVVQPGSKRHSSSDNRLPPASSKSSRRKPLSDDAAQIPWWAGLLAVVIIGAVVVGGILIFERNRRTRAQRLTIAPTPTAQTATAPGATQAAAPADPERQRFQELVVQIHGIGGAESPELAALLNAEAKATFQALTEGCEASPDGCESQRQTRNLLLGQPDPVPRAARVSNSQPPRWLAGLKIPAIGAEDHPDVRRWLEYYSSHPVGRELFQTMLFRCGSYQDLIDKTLVHYGLPRELLAVVLTESGCVPNAESPVGARGLWQFMAPTARAYHLYVQDGVIDERLSPVKATEAAVKFLGDLHRKMGSWDIALASYNAGSGPFRMLARIRQAGGQASFWDLADAERIPEETARYVPRIQAYALILANLRRFEFSTAQMRAAEDTADLDVPSGARLGQVARAAGTSVAYLRSLNPDLVGTVVPTLPNKRFLMQIPKVAAFRARETLDQLLGEQLDLCVSSAFDWGRERFTAEMQAKCAATTRSGK